MVETSIVDDRDIARWRLRNQHLVEPYAASAADVVTSLLAVQAENPSQSAWAVACRTRHPDQADLAALLADGRVIRTHVLRPTWHYVSADDLWWLLELTSPRIEPMITKQLRDVHGLDGKAISRATVSVLRALAERGDLTRTGVSDALREQGTDLNGNVLMVLLAHVELERLICSGIPCDGEHTYALLGERVPSPRKLDRDDALAEISLRYFTGHGPATVRDLSYWATLTVTDARRGLESVRDRLASFEHDGRTYWHGPGEEPPRPQRPRAHLLQVLDETYRGYQDSRWVLDADGHVPRVRETAIGMALVDAQLVAGMKRTIAARKVTFDLRPFRRLAARDTRALEQAAQRYASFLGLDPVLDLRSA